MLADTTSNRFELGFGAIGVDDEVPIAVRKRGEIALGVDDDLLHMGRALLQQAAQEMRLAGPGITLDEQTGRQQLLDIDRGRP